MSARFITYVIIGVAFGFTQLWFVYWVVKILKEKQRLITARRAGGQGGASPAAPAKTATAPSAPVEDGAAAEKRGPNPPEQAGTRGPAQP